MSTNKREDILNAALILFSERGYDGTTVPMIADKAQVGAGTIYRYFESKEVLVNILFQTHIQKFSDLLKHNYPDESSDMREQFRHVFQQMVRFARGDMHALSFIDSHCSAYYLDEQSNRMFKEFLDFIRSTLEKGKKLGIIKDLPSDALISIVYGAFVCLFRLIQKGAFEESFGLLESIEECCWNAIRVY